MRLTYKPLIGSFFPPPPRCPSSTPCSSHLVVFASLKKCHRLVSKKLKKPTDVNIPTAWLAVGNERTSLCVCLLAQQTKSLLKQRTPKHWAGLVLPQKTVLGQPTKARHMNAQSYFDTFSFLESRHSVAFSHCCDAIGFYTSQLSQDRLLGVV